MSEKRVDFRELMSLKLTLFKSPLLTTANRLPSDEFTRIVQESEFACIKN
jgi:hypothetical protein